MPEEFKKPRGKKLWKFALAFLVIVGIMGLVYIQQGNSILGFDLPALGGNGGGISLPSGFGSLLNTPTGDGFQFYIESDENPFAGYRISVSNGAIEASGTHADNIAIGDTVYQTSGSQETVEVQGFRGTVEFDEFGLMIVSGKASQASVGGGRAIEPKGDSFDVSFSVIADEFFVSPISQKDLQLSGLYGKLERTSEGVSTYTMSGSTLRIYDFFGSLSKEGDYLLSGFASQIAGPTFIWK
jgi:hypothetical protein